MALPVQCYLRIGKGRNGYKVAASLHPNAYALNETRDGTVQAIPTVQLKLKLELSPTAFAAAEIAIPIDDEQLQALEAEAEVE